MKSEREQESPSVNIPVQEPNSEGAPSNDPGPAAGTGQKSPHAPATAALTTGELDSLREQAAKAQEHWDRFVRLNADFDNFKKRAAKDRLDAIKYANEALMEKLLPVVDNFEAALAATGNTESPSLDSLATGVKMIATQLKGVLAESGLEEIDAAGKPFDPTIHEAISQQQSTDVPEGHVLQQVRKGYRLKDRLVRPAAVVVATRSGPAGGLSAHA